jgi:HK97 family phage portal protein
MMFGRKPRADTIYNQLKMLNGYNAVFTTWGNDPYSTDVVRSAVDAIARNAAKLKPKHIKRAGKEIQPVAGQVERVLQVRPNPNMSTYDFLYKMVTALMIDNNVFAYPVWEGSTLKAVWPVIAQQTEFIEDQLGQIGVRFWFSDDSIILPYDEVIHLRRHFYKNDMAGENNKALNNTLEAIHTTNEGLGQAVKTSASLRGILKYQGILKESDIKANRDRFVAEYLVVQNNGGVAALDSKADYTELKSQPLMVDAAQMKELRENVYRYYGINEKIIIGDYSNERTWEAFYESTLEPLAVQMSLEFTSKLFTTGERGRGHEIVFEANRLQYVSTRTKVQMLKDLAPLGLFTINEGREIFNLAPVEGGDKRIQTLNVVDADKAGKYQLGEDDDPEDE